MINDALIETLLETCQFISQKGYSPATAGNFSVRVNAENMLISGSGKDKSQLSKHDFVLCDYEANVISGDDKPGDETLVHGAVYQLSKNVQCVLHTHSIATTVLSMLESKSILSVSGYEMQKVLAGQTTHDTTLTLPILENSQDMSALSKLIHESWAIIQPVHVFIVKGHGLYSWGNSIFEAKRHMEGLEFLIACELERRRFL